MDALKKKIDIELFLLCYNEQKMIPHALNYYTKFCSRITIFDNDSTDNSVELIRAFDENICILRLDSNGEHREDLLIETRNNCWKESIADYVIVCDMDEFLYDEFLVEKLLLSKERKIAIPIIVGYNMRATKFPEDYTTLITKQVTHGVKDRKFDKNIIFDPKQVKNINFGPGSHRCSPEFYTKNTRDELIEFKLLHYKYLDKSYLYERHQGYSKRMSSVNKENNWGYEYLLGNNHIDEVYDSSDYLLKVIRELPD